MTTDTSTEAVTALMDGVTAGPWEWGGHPDSIKLQTVNHGKMYVMDFVRKGFAGAQPRFQPKGRGMVKADELLQFQVGDRSIVGQTAARSDGSVYRYDVRGIDHPDARFIAAARELVPALLAERDALAVALLLNRRAIERLTAERDAQYEQNADQIVRIAEMEAQLDAARDRALDEAALAVASADIGYHDGISGDWHQYSGPSIISGACSAIRALKDTAP